MAQPWEQLWAASVDAAVGAMRRHIGGRVGAAVGACVGTLVGVPRDYGCCGTEKPAKRGEVESPLRLGQRPNECDALANRAAS